MNDEERLRADPSPGSPSAPGEPSADLPEAVAESDAVDPIEQLVEELEPIAEAAAAAGPEEVDTAFSEDLDPETLAFGAPKPQALVCQWCNGSLESGDLEVCPHCGSRLRPTDEDLVVPGVTTLSAEAARALELAEIQRNREAAKSGEAMYTTPSLANAAAVVPAPDEATVEAANRPPDDEVRRIMLELELEARQARAMASARSDIEAMIVDDASQAAEAEAGSDATADVEPDAGATAVGADGTAEPAAEPAEPADATDADATAPA